MIRINNIICPYRDYGEFIICYSKIFQEHFILENIYVEFFRYYYIMKYSLEQAEDIILKNYSIDREQLHIDFLRFIGQINEYFTDNRKSNIEEYETNKAISDKMIFDYMAKEEIPFSATIEVTDNCNLMCKHCYRGMPDKTYWNIYTWENALEQLKNLGTLHLTITGGEPFLHPQIMDLLKIANDKGFVISIQTNATYDFRGIISDLKDFTIKTVFISLYAASKEVHDTITEVLGSFEKTERSIRCLTINDIPVSINCPVMTYNRNEMEGLKKFCDILGIKCNFAFKIIPSQIEDKQTMSLNCFSTNFLKKCINNPVLKLYEAELSMIRKTIPKDRYCQTGFRSITLDAQGNVLLCNAYRKLCGSVKEMQIKDIWENSWVLLEWRNIKSYINKKCLHCEAYAYCEPCPAHTYTLTGKDEEIDEISCAFGKALYCADNF